MKTEITRKDEEKFLKLRIAENKIFNNVLTFDEIINSISKGEISLEVSEEDGTKIIDDSNLSEIKRVIPFLLKIINKPRSFIKSYEEKVAVETAKRINYKAISKLSQDSNDWYCRTLLSVKPKNILSDISEETIDLYENRFICSLIDKISELLSQAHIYYQGQLKMLDDNAAFIAMNKEYNYSTESFRFFNKIVKHSKERDDDISYRNKVLQELADIKKLENKIVTLKKSDFYKELHKKRKVIEPIQKTNILMFEYNYNQAYKLWKYLNQIHQSEKLDLNVEVPEGELEGYYTLYSLLCIFSALYDMGFRDLTKNTISYKDNQIILSGKLKFKRGEDIIELSVSKKCIELEYCYNSKQNKVDRFYFYPLFADFEQMNRSKVDELTEEILNGFIDNDKHSTISSRYALVSIDMNRCSEKNTFSTKVYRRFYSIGNNFSNDEKPINLTNWGSYKAGIVILSPVQMRNNFLKIEKIINYHLLKNKDSEAELHICPLCGGKNIKNIGEKNYSCYDCNHNISITYCNKCDLQHKRPIIWVKYINDKFLNNEKVVRGLTDMNIYYKISKIETIMGEKATTAFELEKEASGWKLKTICPYCGAVLGGGKEKSGKITAELRTNI